MITRTGALNSVTTYAYDSYGNMTSMTDARNNTTYFDVANE